MTQFSLFGAAAAAPTLDDLGGVLLGGGHWVRDATGTARLSVVVADAWRADALAAEFADRGVGGDGPYPSAAGIAVRTGFSGQLTPIAHAWTRGATEAPPPAFLLTPGGLRLWAVTSGRGDDAGYLLGTPLPDDEVHRVAGAQLAHLGLAAVSIHRGGSGWRITSTKRLRRLHELIGTAPERGAGNWPRGS